MFKKLDLYIAKKFLGTFMFMVIVIMSIAIVIDISQRLKVFTDPESELTFLKIATGYYPYFFIHYLNLFSSLIIFLSVLLFTSIMARRSEIIAILSNGVSFKRFTVPYFVVSTILLSFALLSNHILVPLANKNRVAFENKYIWPHNELSSVNLLIDDSTYVHYESYAPSTGEVNGMWIEYWQRSEKGVMELYKDIQIDVARGDSHSKDWLLSKVFIRYIEDSSEQIVQFEQIDTTLSFNMLELGYVNNTLESMTTKELVAYRDRQKKKGASDIPQIEIVLHERTALPFASYILTLIGLSVASRKSREGVGRSLIIGLSIGFLYIFFMKMTAVAATNVGLSPALAVWVPNAFYGILAIVIFSHRVRSEESFSLEFILKWFRRG